MAWASSGQSPTIQLTDADIRGGLIAMVTVRDPVGTTQDVEGAHGSAFDRVGAFQVGFHEGVQRCSELLEDPLPLLSNPFIDQDDFLNDGDLPYGFDEGSIVPLVVTALNLYWTFDAGGAGIEFPELTLVPVSSTDEVECPDLTPSQIEHTAVGVSVDERGVLRRTVRRAAVRRPDRGSRRLRRRLPARHRDGPRRPRSCSAARSPVSRERSPTTASSAPGRPTCFPVASCARRRAIPAG